LHTMRHHLRFIAMLLLTAGSMTTLSRAATPEHVSVVAKPGDALSVLLARYGLLEHACNQTAFLELNRLKADKHLLAGNTYRLPIQRHRYDGTSIRSTLGTDDLENARRIQAYNEAMLQQAVKSGDYRSDLDLWVPYHLNGCNGTAAAATAADKTVGHFPIFGAERATVERKSTRLSGRIYYLVSGHGGPDPGAAVKASGYMLCEDEYAYDVTLRLAHNLLAHGAKVYLIIRDPNDGIRDEAYLDPDKDEQCWKAQAIPASQQARLKQRVKAINTLYRQESATPAGKQRAIVIHVDSRARKRRVDMFFYHHAQSNSGKALAEKLRQTIREKYQTFQQNRGYSGTVKSRNLYLLSQTTPTTVYIELGNLRNTQDQKRFTVTSNRQAMADWLAEGLLKEAG
ncbi:MAG: N-acetylmuramoyl-L-alanine amidase, partial [Bacteroidota bacterium]